LLILDRGDCGDSGRRNDPLKCTTQRDFGDKDDKPQKAIKNQHTERIEVSGRRAGFLVAKGIGADLIFCICSVSFH
jgi:hypothetical protein